MAESKLLAAKMKFAKDIKNISNIGLEAADADNNEGQMASMSDFKNIMNDDDFGEDMSEDYGKLSMSPPGDSFRIDKKIDHPVPRQAQKNNQKVHEMPIIKNLDLGKLAGMQEEQEMILQEDDSESAMQESDPNRKEEKNMARQVEQEIMRMYLKLKQTSMPDDNFNLKKEKKFLQSLHVMELLTKLGQEVDNVINMRMLDDYQKFDGDNFQTDSLRKMMKNVGKGDDDLDYEFVDEAGSDFKIKSVIEKQANQKKLRDSRYKSADLDEKIDNLQPSQTESHFTSIAGPLPIYEEVMQGLEADIRKHIRIEHQLKLHIESVEDRVEELEREQEAFQKEITELQEHKRTNESLKKELSSKEEVLDVKQILLQKQKNEIEEAKKQIGQKEIDIQDLKKMIQLLQVEKAQILKKLKESHHMAQHKNAKIQQQNVNPYNSFLEDSNTKKMMQMVSNISGQSGFSGQSLGSETSINAMAQQKQHISSQNKKSYDQLSLNENRNTGLALHPKMTSSTRNTQKKSNTSQLGFIHPDGQMNQSRSQFDTQQYQQLSGHSQQQMQPLANQQQNQNLIYIKANAKKQNSSLLAGSNRNKSSQNNMEKLKQGAISQNHTPNNTGSVFYSKTVQKQTKKKQKQVSIEKFGSLYGTQPFNNIAATQSTINLSSGLLGPQLHLSSHNLGQIQQPMTNDEVIKKSRTPDKLKIKSKAKLIVKEPGQDFQITQEFNNQNQNNQTNSRSHSQQAQYHLIPEKSLTGINQQNIGQEGGSVSSGYGILKIGQRGGLGSSMTQQTQKLTSKAKLQNIYASNNQQQKQQFRGNKNQTSQERQHKQLANSAAQQMVNHRVTGSRNGGMKNYNTVATVDNTTNKKLDEQKRQVMKNQWILAQENEKNQGKYTHGNNKEINYLTKGVKTGIDNSSTGATDSTSIKALQRRCSSQMGQKEQTGPGSIKQQKSGLQEVDYSRAILNISQSSIDKGKSSKISQSSLNNTQKLKSSSRKGNSAKRQSQNKYSKDAINNENKQQQVMVKNRVIPSRDNNNSSVLGQIIKDSQTNTMQSMQKMIPRMTNPKGVQ